MTTTRSQSVGPFSQWPVESGIAQTVLRAIHSGKRLGVLFPRVLRFGFFQSQHFAFLGEELGRLVEDRPGIFAANGTILRLPAHVLHDAGFAKVVIAGGRDWIFEMLATQVTGKGQPVVWKIVGAVAGGWFPSREILHFLLLLLSLGLLFLFPLLLELPPRQGVAAVVQVNAGIAKATKSRFLIVLTNIRLVIEAGRDADRSRRANGTGVKGVAFVIPENAIVAGFAVVVGASFAARRQFRRMVLRGARDQILCRERFLFGGFVRVQNGTTTTTLAAAGGACGLLVGGSRRSLDAFARFLQQFARAAFFLLLRRCGVLFVFGALFPQSLDFAFGFAKHGAVAARVCSGTIM